MVQPSQDRTPVALWGSSEHETPESTSTLTETLSALGATTSVHPLGSPPPRDAVVCVVNTKTRVGAPEMDAMPDLRLVITTTSGYDHVDLNAASERGVSVARCPLARRDAVVDASVAMALALLRRLPRIDRASRDGDWIRPEMKRHPMPTLRDATVGLFGAGVIGRRAADVWRALGAEVLVHDPALPESTGKNELLSRSTITSLHCSLTPSSHRLIDADAVARLRPGAVVVNTARGECVDLDALLAAEHLGGVGLDVFEREPPPDLARLAGRDDVLATPHSAGYHAGLNDAIRVEVTDIVRAFLEQREIPGRIG